MHQAKVFIGILVGVTAFVFLAAYSSLLAVLGLYGVIGLLMGIRSRRWALRTLEARRLIAEADAGHDAYMRGLIADAPPPPWFLVSNEPAPVQTRRVA